MFPEQWVKIRQIFEEALDTPAERLDTWLDSRCAGDAALASEVRRLLRGHQKGPALLDRVQQALVSSVPDNNLNRRVGPYELLEEIGHGGMGAVYRAARADDAYHKTVAVKLLGFQLAGPFAETAFRKERQILAGLEHPNIARLLDGGSTREGLLYLVMELVEGEPIDQYCERRRLDLDSRLKLFDDVCSSVGYAHRNLVVHRDLKPRNILVTSEGIVKLLDFGIAKALSETGAQEETIGGRMTPQYASPEQIKGLPIGTASDLYSLGLVLYEVLTGGVRPYEVTGENLREAILAICENDPPRPSHVARTPFRNRLRGDLDSLVSRALAKDSAARYSSIEQLQEDIRRYRTGRPLIARGDALAYRLRKSLRRHRSLATAAALLFASLSAGVIAIAYEAKLTARQKTLAEKRAGEAEQSRRAMEDEKRRADRERQRAEERSAEAQRQRLLAEERYDQVRSLATTVLFDIHDSIRSLAGSGPARKLAIDKGLQYLEALAKTSDGDPKLQAELAAGYERAGRLTGSLFDIGSEGGQAALPVHEKALALRRQVLAQRPQDPVAHLALVNGMMLYADGQVTAGRTSDAVATYSKVRMLHQSTPTAHEKREWLRPSALIDARLCLVRYMVESNAVTAIRSCEDALSSHEKLIRMQPDDKAMVSQYNSLHVALGNILRLSGKPGEALAHFRIAIDGIGDQLLQNPGDAFLLRARAGFRMYLAATLDQLGDASAPDEYAAAITELERSLLADPEQLSTTATLSLTLQKYSALLRKTGHAAEGEVAYERAIALLRRLAEKPKAGAMEFNDLSTTLVRSPYPRLRNPQYALELATRAAALTNERDANTLVTLAEAYFANQQKDKAVETARKALTLLPPAGPGPSSGVRREIEDALKSFENPPAQ